MASFQIATIYKDHATLRGYEKCGLNRGTRHRTAGYLFERPELPVGSEENYQDTQQYEDYRQNEC